MSINQDKYNECKIDGHKWKQVLKYYSKDYGPNRSDIYKYFECKNCWIRATQGHFYRKETEIEILRHQFYDINGNKILEE